MRFMPHPEKEYDMCKINCEIVEGLVPDERTARIKNFEGHIEEVSVSVALIDGRTLMAHEIGRQGNKVLVELPRESSAGRWRVWVGEDQLVK